MKIEPEFFKKPPKPSKINVNYFFMWMLVFIPISIALKVSSYNNTLLFVTSILALVPIARYLGKATEQISIQTNNTIGALLNATFGNIIELIIAILAISRGYFELVQASIVGSIMGNILLLVGLSIFFGGLKFTEQRFNKQAAGVSSTMLIISVVGLSVPTLFAYLPAIRGAQPRLESILILSLLLSGILALVYIAGLLFTLFTHKHLFDITDEYTEEHIKPEWTRRFAAIVLFVFIIFAALESEFLISTISHASESMGLSQTFIGIVIVAIITNIAEKSAAVTMALRNKISLSIEIGTSSAIQIALFVVPILVFVSTFILHKPFTVLFSFFQIIAMIFAVMIVNYLSSDGRCNWLEGLQLISVYLILAVAFYFV
ncbi:calcium/proton exchanger [Candidatus Woesearchaeota archaeon]|nr:calcium/proton exchanger [Candidatus Woesearchaeota archaeon]